MCWFRPRVPFIIIIRVWTDECRIHLPCFEWACNAGAGSIVEQKYPSGPINCLCWINPRSNSCSPTLSKAFDYRMIHLQIYIHNVPNWLWGFYWQCQHVHVFVWTTTWYMLTNTLIENFSPSSTGTKLPYFDLLTSFASEDLQEINNALSNGLHHCTWFDLIWCKSRVM